MTNGFKPLGSEFQINAHWAGLQGASTVTSLLGGGYVVAWESDGQDGSNLGVYGQRYNADGSVAGSEFQINTVTSSNQWQPSIAALDTGGFVVTWQSFLQDGSLSGIYGQLYSAGGAAVGAEFSINTETLDQQLQPAISTLGGGGFVVTWQSYGQDGSGYGLFGQRFTSAGASTGDEFQINSYTSNTQTNASVTDLAGGGFVVTWQSEAQDGENYGVFGQLFNASGTPTGAEFQVNTYTATFQDNPSVTGLSGGGICGHLGVLWPGWRWVWHFRSGL